MSDAAERLIDAALGTVCTAAVLLVEGAGKGRTYAAGTLCPDPDVPPDAPCTAASLFDLASLTKLATTALVLALVREKALALDLPFRELVPDFRGPGKDRVTLEHVLTHTAGLRWWLPLYQDASSAEEACWRAAQEPLAQDVGTCVYSDLGFVMLRAGLERAGGTPLGRLLADHITGPVAAESAGYGPRDPESCAASERDMAWRGRRLRGEVHDENASAMGGVSGHAGLFGTAADVLGLMRVFRDGAVIGNDLATLARREHARAGAARRGLGLMLGAPYLSSDSYGHTGFTGTSVWVDPTADLTVVLLTNRLYFGGYTDHPRRPNDAATYELRRAVHEALLA